MVYTHDPALDMGIETYDDGSAKTGVMLRRAQESKAKLEDALAKYGIAAYRVVYMIPAKDAAMYCPESPAVYKHFIETYQAKGLFKPTDWICHDAGNAYKEEDEYIFDSYGLPNRVVYPPINHHSVSPNDHDAHAVKAAWHARGDHSDDVESTLFLMKLLDDIPAKDIKGWWARNFCADTVDGPDAGLVTALKKLLFPSAKRQSTKEHHDECLQLFYDNFTESQDEAEAPAVKKPKKGIVFAGAVGHARA